MRLSLALGSGKALVIDLDAPLAACGQALLERLRPAAEGLGIAATATVDLDWARLQLRADAATIEIEEPDYSRDPGAFISGATLTCQILNAEQRMLKTLGLAGDPVQAGQYIRVSEAALQAEVAIGYREADPETPFSGWRILPAPPTQAGDFGLYTARELAMRRPAWFAALALPPGWAFRFAGDILVDCQAPSDETHRLMLPVF